MTDRTLKTLGFADVPAQQPLTYPGRPITHPTLLTTGELWDLTPAPGRLGTWTVNPRPDDNEAPAEPLDTVLTQLGHPPTPHRHPVIAVGSNASPADATEYPNYRRVLLPGSQYPMVMPSGERLRGAYLYVGERGVLMSPDGTERPLPGGGDQSALLTRLLAGSPRLRALLGPDPRAWVTRAGGDPAVRSTGTRIFQEEGWALPQPDLLRCPEDGQPGEPSRAKSYDALSFPE
ncbi:hypothetical protein [Streptomyces asiaticus]|uniref:hypothetical protein n=1 Tax=Streptomyces asiaticus TaxID=114695 RepID=UPI003D740F5A